MQTNEKVVALDVDGVLMECFPPINQCIIDKFNVSSDFRIQGVVHSWNMQELPEKIRRFALDCMGDARIVEQYTFKKGSKKFVKNLYNYITANNGKLVFNTHCFNEDVARVRYHQLKTLSSELGIFPEYNISVGPTKVNAPAYIIIDDHIGNLDNSDAPVKILFSMFHNKYLDGGTAFRSRNYNQILDYVKENLYYEKCKN